VRVAPERIAYIVSDGNYSTMMLTDKAEHLFSFNLTAFEKQIEQQLGNAARTFIRLGKSLIINGTYIHHIHVSKQQIILSDTGFSENFTLSASKEALRVLKNLLEESINKQEEQI
jgi:DNA-binding LytR/AlgR family response regulator